MAKKIKVKLPKRIAGVKIPKGVRKGPVRDFLNSSAGQLIIAEAVVLAGGALAAKGTDPDSTTGDALRHPADAIKSVGRRVLARGSDAKDHLSQDTGRLSFAMSEAMRAFRAALEQPADAVVEPTGRADASRPSRSEVTTDESGKKKSASSPNPPH
jgi:hypothetical protein